MSQVGPTRYLLDSDDDGHWYLMPVEDRDAFTAWVYRDGPEVPTILSLGSHPSTVTFEVPEHFGEAVEEASAR